jgi:hypothetical protein
MHFKENPNLFQTNYFSRLQIYGCRLCIQQITHNVIKKKQTYCPSHASDDVLAAVLPSNAIRVTGHYNITLDINLIYSHFKNPELFTLYEYVQRRRRKWRGTTVNSGSSRITFTQLSVNCPIRFPTREVWAGHKLWKQGEGEKLNRCILLQFGNSKQ